jgi:hypothetical protein
MTGYRSHTILPATVLWLVVVVADVAWLVSAIAT